MARHDIELREREKRLYSALTDWPDTQALVVGGYAASAWSFPRFSQDLDFLVAQQDADTVRDHLEAHGLGLVDEKTQIEQNYGGSWERWEGNGRSVTIDLLVNSIQDRDFQIPTTLKELWKDRSRRPIRGISESGVELPVASKEALIALKSQPMRPRDIGDICAIAYVGYDAERLHRLLTPAIEQRNDLFQERITRLNETLGPSPDTLKRILGPRIPRFTNMQNDMMTVVGKLLMQLQRWADD